MGVFAPQENMGMDGLGDAHAAFVEAHESNSKQLLNLAEGRKKNEPRPVYDPSHPDNLWPLMVHHAAKGELTIGKTLKGVTSPSERAQITKANEKAKADALASGYRLEPYIKPQVAVLNPEAEKAALLRRNQELEGQINTLTDEFSKIRTMLEAQK